jgi:hypothetical protein
MIHEVFGVAEVIEGGLGKVLSRNRQLRLGDVAATSFELSSGAPKTTQ